MSHIGVPPRTQVKTEMRRLDFSGRDMRSRSKPRDRRKPLPLVEYPRGYFTELIRAHNWPPMWHPALAPDELAAARRSTRSSEMATANAEALIGHAGRDMGLVGSYRTQRPAPLQRGEK